MKKARELSVILCIAVLALAFPSAYATSEIAPQISEADLISSEVVVVDGVQVRLDLYDDNGVLVETATPITAKSSMFNYATLLDVVGSRLSNQRAQLSSSTHYSNSAQSTSNADCFGGHWGDWEFNSSFWDVSKASNNSAVRGLYMAGTPYQIQLHQTFSWVGLYVSFSIPTGFSIGASGDSVSWSSLGYPSTSMATAYTGNFLVSSNFGLGSITMTSRSDVYVSSSVSHATKVSDTFSS